MRYALAAAGFRNEEPLFNKQVILDAMEKCAGKADLVLFGEAFLQGFYGVTFEETYDEGIFITRKDPILCEIGKAAKEREIAVSFGFLEKEGASFYSSQITIGRDGRILDLYRRVSPGWKEPFAGDRYREGEEFHVFAFGNQKIVVGLCGDFWFDENVAQVKALNPDVVLWPVYTDYNPDQWNTSMKLEYAEQAGLLCDNVLYVNSFCLDKEGEEIARGGAAWFHQGMIRRETPSGKEDILFLEV